MNEIKCPHCGQVFTVDESGYAALLNQVRDHEFQRELNERISLAEKNREQDMARKLKRSCARKLRSAIASLPHRPSSSVPKPKIFSLQLKTKRRSLKSSSKH